MKFPVTHRSIDRLKQDAKLLKKSHNIGHAQALDIIAQDNGYNGWKHLLEIDHVQKNLAILDNIKLDYGVLQITQTGIDKSIMDATAPLRSYLKSLVSH